MSRFTNPIPQYDNNTGDLLAGGKLYFYKSGTNTLISIYSNDDETTLIANPVILDAAGRVPNIFYTGTARCVLTDSNDVQIWDVDPVGGENQFGNFSGWNNDTTYNINEFVVGSDGKFYRSLQSGNQGNDPISSPQNNTFWEEVRFRNIWNSSITYQLNDFVQDGDRFYLSKISNNLGNDPSAGTGVNWVDFGDATRLPYDNTISGLTSVNVKAAIDELKNLLDNLPSSVVYRGQLDVSAGDSALPGSPTNGDLYFISVGGTITVSTAGGAPTPTAVNVGDQIIYNGTLSQWDLSPAVDQAVSISYDNTTSGLSSTNVQTAIDELKTLDDDINTILGTVTASEMAQVANINSKTISNVQWGYLGDLNQSLTTTDNVFFGTLTTTSNLNINGGIWSSKPNGSGGLIATVTDGLQVGGAGTTNSVALVNGIGTIALRVPNGSNDVVITDQLTVGGDATVNGDVTGDSFNGTGVLGSVGAMTSNGDYYLTATATDGLVITGKGSNNDITIQNGSAGAVMTVPTGTSDATFSGDVSLTNNGVITELTSLTFDSTGGAIDAAITQQANTGVLSIESGRNASWNGSIQFVTDTVTALTIDSSQNATFSGDLQVDGNVGIGITSSTDRLLVQGGSSNRVMLVRNSSSENIIFTGLNNQTYTAGANGANAAFFTNRDSVTSRSINASGTINASGADYAEYEVKADTEAVINKGDIVGFDADGKVTNKFSESISFAIKSTDPNLVGGDTWAVTPKPEPIELSEIEYIGIEKPEPILNEDGNDTQNYTQYESDQ
jgi:hypothetical protein